MCFLWFLILFHFIATCWWCSWFLSLSLSPSISLYFSFSFFLSLIAFFLLSLSFSHLLSLFRLFSSPSFLVSSLPPLPFSFSPIYYLSLSTASSSCHPSFTSSLSSLLVNFILCPLYLFYSLAFFAHRLLDFLMYFFYFTLLCLTVDGLTCRKLFLKTLL